jgi:hypothetical protein
MLFERGFGRGYVERDYGSVPQFSVYEESPIKRLPRGEWKSRIEHLNEAGAQPYHWHKLYVKIRSQSRFPYCWSWGTCCAIEVAYSMQGVGSPHLNAHALAYRGKNGALRGGFATEACKYIQEYGVPQESVLGGFVKQRSWSKEVQANADKHKLVDFNEIAKNDLDMLVSCLIGESPQPATIALSWWRHLVCALGVTIDKRGNVGIIFANSWGTKYKEGGLDGGYGILWGKKAIPYESVAVRHVKSRTEVS